MMYASYEFRTIAKSARKEVATKLCRIAKILFFFAFVAFAVFTALSIWNISNQRLGEDEISQYYIWGSYIAGCIFGAVPLIMMYCSAAEVKDKSGKDSKDNAYVKFKSELVPKIKREMKRCGLDNQQGYEAIKNDFQDSIEQKLIAFEQAIGLANKIFSLLFFTPISALAGMLFGIVFSKTSATEIVENMMPLISSIASLLLLLCVIVFFALFYVRPCYRWFSGINDLANDISLIEDILLVEQLGVLPKA